jgi:integrase
VSCYVTYLFFERAEFEAVIAALPEYLQDFTRFAFLCGWRKGQIASLKWEHVNRNAGEAIAPGQIVKNKDSHKVVLEGDLAEIIERRWSRREYEAESGPAISEYVFHLDGRRVADFRKAWASACEAAGVSGRLFHDLRRSCVRDLIRGGVHQTVAMKISGHKTPSMFARYNISSDADLREAMRQRQEYLKAQPAVSNIVAFGKAGSQ